MAKITNTKGRRRGTYSLYVLLATKIIIYKKGDIVNIKRMGTVQKGMPHKQNPAKPEGSIYSVTHHAVSIVVNKQVRARFLPKN